AAPARVVAEAEEAELAHALVEALVEAALRVEPARARPHLLGAELAHGAPEVFVLRRREEIVGHRGGPPGWAHSRPVEAPCQANLAGPSRSLIARARAAGLRSASPRCASADHRRPPCGYTAVVGVC